MIVLSPEDYRAAFSRASDALCRALWAEHHGIDAAKAQRLAHAAFEAVGIAASLGDIPPPPDVPPAFWDIWATIVVRPGYEARFYEAIERSRADGRTPQPIRAENNAWADRGVVDHQIIAVAWRDEKDMRDLEFESFHSWVVGLDQPHQVEFVDRTTGEHLTGTDDDVTGLVYFADIWKGEHHAAIRRQDNAYADVGVLDDQVVAVAWRDEKDARDTKLDSFHSWVVGPDQADRVAFVDQATGEHLAGTDDEVTGLTYIAEIWKGDGT